MNTVALMRVCARLLGFYIPPVFRASLLVVCFLALSACSTMPAGTGFNAPARAENTLPRKAWIGTVKIADDSVEDKSIVEDSLRGNIAAYIQEAGYFLETGSLPGKVSADDLVLDFRFDRYIQKRSVHPAYIPLAALTLYLYEIFGGPVFVDESDLSVTLSVHDGAGRSMGNFFSQAQEEHNVSLWSSEYSLPSGIKVRTSLMQELMSKACADIQNKFSQ